MKTQHDRGKIMNQRNFSGKHFHSFPIFLTDRSNEAIDNHMSYFIHFLAFIDQIIIRLTTLFSEFNETFHDAPTFNFASRIYYFIKIFYFKAVF